MNTGMQTKVRLATVLAGPPVFAHAMRAARLHVGMGGTPVCVTCGETWPCSTELAVWLMARDIARTAGRATIRREDLYRAERFHGHRITNGRPR